MNVTESYVRRLEITGVERLDPIRVVLEDIAPSAGRINIECWGQAWANYWGAMGSDDIAGFFRRCSVGYLAGKLSSIPNSVFDSDSLIDSCKKQVLRDRRKRLSSRSEARKNYDQITDLDPLPETIEGLWYHHGELMQELLGDEWWYGLPEKPNPDYVYLTKIVETVKQALAVVEKQKGGAA